MKKLFLTFALFVSMQTIAQTELIDFINNGSKSLITFTTQNDTVFNSLDCKTKLTINDNGFVVNCKGDMVDAAYSYAINNYDYIGYCFYGIHEYQVFTNGKVTIEILIHKTRVMNVFYN